MMARQLEGNIRKYAEEGSIRPQRRDARGFSMASM
jgi:hypothetical protein